jgi:hypothetical protein
MRRPVLVTLLLVAIACSQRVTPEEGYAARERERPLIPASEIPASATESTGSADAAAIRVQIDGPVDFDRPAPDVVGLPAEVLFVFVRPVGATEGPPLAVRRIEGPSFPLSLSIGPSDAMIPGTTFPDRVVIHARIDIDGIATTTSPSDWAAASEPVAPGGEARIVLARIGPS